MVGKVYLVGAGPGDEGLMTIKGMEKIEMADSIVYDELANARLLDHANKACEIIYVGKKAGNHSLHQEKINQLLVKLAREGKRVVRLKGGDPYVFGRGGEEGQVLYKEQIPFEVVPGITSAIGGLAYAGIPITHREVASSFHVITGHLKSEALELEFEALAKIKGTLVFLMGVENLHNICEKLMLNGKDPRTPCAVIYRASTPSQRTLVSSLGELMQDAKAANIEPPSLIVIGEVVKYRDQLNFFESKPLFGKRIAVTRSRVQASDLVKKIEDLGGIAIPCPILKNEPIPSDELQKAIDEISKYTHIIFTSVNGVDLFFKELYKKDMDARALWGTKITAIGKTTQDHLGNRGIRADFVPQKYVGEGIVELLSEKLEPTDRILIPRSENARDYLVTELSKLCQVEEVILYRTVFEEDREEGVDELLKRGEVDFVTFASSSTVDFFIQLLGKDYKEILEKVKLVSIGPITSKQIRHYGLTVDYEAKEYTIDGMIEEIIKAGK